LTKEFVEDRRYIRYTIFLCFKRIIITQILLGIQDPLANLLGIQDPLANLLEIQKIYCKPLGNTESSCKPLGKKVYKDPLANLLGIQNPLGKLSDKKLIIKFIRKLTIFMIFKK